MTPRCTRPSWAAPAGPPRLCVVVGKAYVASHRRTLPDGRVITVPAYFTKVVAKPDAPATPRRRKQAEVSHAYAKQDPTKLALRLVAHVEDGTMSHEHAEANLAHLERRATPVMRCTMQAAIAGAGADA